MSDDKLVPYSPVGVSDIFNKKYISHNNGQYYTEEVSLGSGEGSDAGSGTNYLGQVGSQDDLLGLVFTLTTGTYYASGDVFDDVQPIPNAMRVALGKGTLASIFVFNDDDAADLAFDLYFFDASGTLGTQDAACSISDAYLHHMIGNVSFAAADLTDLGGNRFISKKPSDLGFLLKSDENNTLWAGSVYRGTSGTYSANGVQAKIGVWRS